MTPDPTDDCKTPLTPRAARALHARLLERVADDESSHVTIPLAEGDWQPFVPGVTIKVLQATGGTLSYLMRLAPGASVPAHRHPADEECIVLDGLLRVGARIELGPGGYHLAHAGSLHATLRSDTGATVFLRGAFPDARDVLG